MHFVFSSVFISDLSRLLFQAYSTYLDAKPQRPRSIFDRQFTRHTFDSLKYLFCSFLWEAFSIFVMTETSSSNWISFNCKYHAVRCPNQFAGTSSSKQPLGLRVGHARRQKLGRVLGQRPQPDDRPTECQFIFYTSPQNGSSSKKA